MYKTEIIKVLITMIFFNFVALIFMSWMWQLSKQIKSMIKDREFNAKEQRRVYEEQLERLRRARGPEARAKPLEIKLMLTDAERIVREFEAKGLSD